MRLKFIVSQTSGWLITRGLTLRSPAFQDLTFNLIQPYTYNHNLGKNIPFHKVSRLLVIGYTFNLPINSGWCLLTLEAGSYIDRPFFTI